ncbi:toxofilin [Striga asiatica]|uniref:Toxofilin n=1 Tax=Striga asiatica TaxID=4170 RepID=A0A5A7QJ67_STRAF|nr:toxofilin [Striga asiatica]
MVVVKFWFSTRVSEGKSKLCHRGLSPAPETIRFEAFESQTLAPEVWVDQNTLELGSDRTRLPLNISWADPVHLAGLVGLADHNWTEDGTWMMERLSRGWNDVTDGSGVALNPTRSSDLGGGSAARVAHVGGWKETKKAARRRNRAAEWGYL